MGLRTLLTPQVAAQPDATALVGSGMTFTFAQLDDRIARAVSVLDARVAAGAPVAVVGANHPDWVVAQHAVPRSGRLLAFLNHRLAAPELREQIERAGAALVLGESAQLARLRDAGTEIAMLDWAEWDALLATSAPGAGASVDDDAPAWLLFTSGTTGRPKGALLTARSLRAAVAASTAARPVDPDDVYVFPFPLCHVAAYNVLHRHAHGRPVVLIDRFEPEAFAEAVATNGATSTSLAATMLASLLDWIDERAEERVALLVSLRTIAYGAAPMPAALLQRASDRLGVEFAQGYGMTELSGNAVFLDADAHRRGLAGEPELLRAAGRPAPGVEVRIAADGEICVRAPQMMLGYLDDPEATAATIVDGWLHTGDAGRIDEDGYLHVVDRIKDIVITGGENVSSLEVEDVLMAHGSVAAVAVIGIPDPTWGENVCAVVVARDGFDAESLVAHARERLAGFKAPRHVVVVDSLPVNAAGKVRKAELRQLLAERPDLLGPRR